MFRSPTKAALTPLLVLCACVTTLAQNAESEAHFRRGYAEYRGGELEPARHSFETCLRLDPGRTDCMTNLASVLIDIGGEEYDAMAEHLYRRVIQAEPSNSDAAYNLALQLQV